MFIVKNKSFFGVSLANGELLVPCIFENLDFAWLFKNDKGADKIIGKLSNKLYFYGSIHSFPQKEKIFMDTHQSLNFDYCKMIHEKDRFVVLSVKEHEIQIDFESDLKLKPVVINHRWRRIDDNEKMLSENVMLKKIKNTVDNTKYELDLLVYKHRDSRYTDYIIDFNLKIE